MQTWRLLLRPRMVAIIGPPDKINYTISQQVVSNPYVQQPNRQISSVTQNNISASINHCLKPPLVEATPTKIERIDGINIIKHQDIGVL